MLTNSPHHVVQKGNHPALCISNSNPKKGDLNRSTDPDSFIWLSPEACSYSNSLRLNKI